MAVPVPCSHAIWVLDDAATHKTVYDFMNKLILEDGYTIVYAAEPNPQKTLKTMAAGGIKARELVETGALRIIDSNQIFSKNNVKSAKKAKGPAFESYFKRQAKGKRRLFIGKPEEYFRSGSNLHPTLITAEQECNHIFSEELKAICLHKRSFLDKMSLSSLVRLLSAHQCIIGGKRGVTIRNPVEIIAPIRIGLDKALNDRYSNDLYSPLVFRTLKLIYNMDYQFIIDHPDIFENTLQKMFRNSANAILRSICDEIIKGMVFD